MLIQHRSIFRCLSRKIDPLHSKAKLRRFHRPLNTGSHGAEVDLIEVLFREMQYAANASHDGGNYQRGEVWWQLQQSSLHWLHQS
jgi:hypothetical protein